MWSIEWLRANDRETLVEREKDEFFFLKKLATQTVTSLFFPETNLSHDGPHRSRSKVISAPQTAYLRMQLKRSRGPRSGTRNGPLEKNNGHHLTMNCSALDQRETNSTGNSARKTHLEHREAETKQNKPRNKQH